MEEGTNVKYNFTIWKKIKKVTKTDRHVLKNYSSYDSIKSDNKADVTDGTVDLVNSKE